MLCIPSGEFTRYMSLDAEQNVSTQVLFAYRMCTGELAGPAGKLSRSLDSSPLLQNTNPWDILNTLRPLKAKVCASILSLASASDPS